MDKRTHFAEATAMFIKKNRKNIDRIFAVFPKRLHIPLGINQMRFATSNHTPPNSRTVHHHRLHEPLVAPKLLQHPNRRPVVVSNVRFLHELRARRR